LLTHDLHLGNIQAYQRDLDGDLETLSAAVDAEYEAWAAQVRRRWGLIWGIYMH
jgi:hypothetical protein